MGKRGFKVLNSGALYSGWLDISGCPQSAFKSKHGPFSARGNRGHRVSNEHGTVFKHAHATRSIKLCLSRPAIAVPLAATPRKQAALLAIL